MPGVRVDLQGIARAKIIDQQTGTYCANKGMVKQVRHWVRVETRLCELDSFL